MAPKIILARSMGVLAILNVFSAQSTLVRLSENLYSKLGIVELPACSVLTIKVVSLISLGLLCNIAYTTEYTSLNAVSSTSIGV